MGVIVVIVKEGVWDREPFEETIVGRVLASSSSTKREDGKGAKQRQRPTANDYLSASNRKQ